MIYIPKKSIKQWCLSSLVGFGGLKVVGWFIGLFKQKVGCSIDVFDNSYQLAQCEGNF
ncbi:hypothetical protein [Vibrio rhizosphaerae]|nr:hypothetical protein [Vibrio rhizosphaerae]